MKTEWEKVYFTDTITCENCGTQALEYRFKNGKWLCKKCFNSLKEREI